MSSSKKTEYYGLSQFEPNDTPTWLGDYNGDMEKIDEAIHNVQENGGSDVTVETEDGKATITVTKDGESEASEIQTITQAQSEKLDGLANIQKIGDNLTLTEDGTLNGEESTVNFNELENRPKYGGSVMTSSTEIPDLSSTVADNTTKIATNASEIAAVNALIQSTQGNLTTEVTNRETADTNLQNQIDALVSKTDVVDIVGDYAQLEAYDTSNLSSRDVIEVLSDVNHNNALSYYRWNEPTAGQWNWIGSISPYYTKSQSDSIFVPATRTINGQSLAQDVIIELPTKLSELTNDAGFITNAALTNLVPNTRTVNGKALSENVVLKTSDLENDSNFVTASQLNAKQNKATGSLEEQPSITLLPTLQSTNTVLNFSSIGYALVVLKMVCSNISTEHNTQIFAKLTKPDESTFNNFYINHPATSKSVNDIIATTIFYIAASNRNVPMTLSLSCDDPIKISNNGITSYILS